MLTFVTENNIDSLFNNVERIIEFYTTAGKADNAIDEKWIKAALLRNLPKTITKDLAMQFKDAKIVNEVRSLINVHIYIYIYIYMCTTTKQACHADTLGPCYA